MDLGLSVLLLLLCLLFSAYFSSLETALSGLSQSQIKKLMDQNPMYAPALSMWIKRPDEILITILVGNNITNTLAAAVATVLAQSIFESYAISIATFFVTIMLLIFGEVTPKTFARHNSDRIAPIGISLLMPIYGLLLPVTWGFCYFSMFLIKLFKVGSSPAGLATMEDIAYIIRLSNEEGAIVHGDGHLLQSVMEFRETLVKESMVSRTEIGSFEVNASYEEVMSRVVKEGHTRWPVYEKNIDNVVGIFHVKDLLKVIRSMGSKHSFSLHQFLRPAKFVPDRMKVGSLLKEFQSEKAHIAVVVDEYGGTAGIISLEDVLEEIVGDIRDEYDYEEPERLHKIDAHNYLASGKVNIFELGKELDVSFPESEGFDSLGGFLIALKGRMPKMGERLYFDDCTFMIKVACEKKITQVHIHQKRQRQTLVIKGEDSHIEERVAA